MAEYLSASEQGEIQHSIGTTIHEYEGCIELLNRAVAHAWHTGKYSDITIKTKGRDIKAHMMILAQCTNLCKDIPDDQADATITLEFEENIVRLVLDFVYLNKVSVPEVDVHAVAKVAEHLGLSELYLKCKTTELSLQTVSTENCLKIWAEAKSLNNKNIIKKARDFSLKNVAKVKRTEQFLSLPLDLLKEYLCHPKLVVRSQEERLGALLNWVRGDSASRKSKLLPLLHALPLYLMGQWYLDQLLDDPLVQGMPQIKQMISEVSEGVSDKQCQKSDVEVSPASKLPKKDRCLIFVGAEISGILSSKVEAVKLQDSLEVVNLGYLNAKPKFFSSCCVQGDYLYVSGLGKSGDQLWRFNFLDRKAHLICK